MDTPGFKTVRYQGRYYRSYNGWEDYPTDSWAKIQAEIPTEREEYAKWLAGQRDAYERLHKQLEENLSVRHYVAGEKLRRNGRSAICPKLISSEKWNIPCYMPEDLRDEDALWEFTIDLDREIFTINNSANFKLDCLSEFCRIRALAKTAYKDVIVLPGYVPQACLADLILEVNPTPTYDFNIYDSLTVKIVNPKSTADIPVSQQHGPLLSAHVFREFRRNQIQILSDLLLGWNVDDLCFREIVFAILCIASPGQNLSLVRSRRVVDSPKAGYSDILSRDRPGESYLPEYLTLDSETDSFEELDEGESPSNVDDDDSIGVSTRNQLSEFDSVDAEFVAHFGVGCHLHENPPGSSAEDSIYWFEGVLVVLAVQLTQAGAVARNVTRVFQYHQLNYAHLAIDAVIISIEHIVLLSIDSHRAVKHTEPLLLFDLDPHRWKNALSRYPSSYFEAIEEHVRKASSVKKAMTKRHAADMMEAIEKRKEKEKWDEAALRSLEGGTDAIYKPEQDLELIHSKGWEEEVKRCKKSEKKLRYRFKSHYRQRLSNSIATKCSFDYLIHFLEVAARKRLRTTQGRLPTEIYRMIIASLPDAETHRNCMKVSTLFRDLCQQQLRLVENFAIRANGTSAELSEDGSFKALHLPTGTIQRLRLSTCCGHTSYNKVRFRVVLRSQRDRRTILHDMEMCWWPIKFSDSDNSVHNDSDSYDSGSDDNYSDDSVSTC